MPAQKGNSKDMLFSVDEIISDVSKFISLKQGDLIFTGTPAGVGPIRQGDNLEGFIEDKALLLCEIR
jgi:2-keto-4-pentenoate hydratase/2-oxohepta-3-ene-1,7-dioic acid hydratase in catechol pathway